jgi:hypothetical protein
VVTDDDAYEEHRDRVRRSDLGRRRVNNGDAERNARRDWIEKLDRPWVKAIYLELWPL